jgi:hypothetical protein
MVLYKLIKKIFEFKLFKNLELQSRNDDSTNFDIVTQNHQFCYKNQPQEDDVLSSKKIELDKNSDQSSEIFYPKPSSIFTNIKDKDGGWPLFDACDGIPLSILMSKRNNKN